MGKRSAVDIRLDLFDDDAMGQRTSAIRD